ncbi:ATP-binding cassette domain-containing protein [Microvirga tunisiensis]|uniref:ATP-binding cassette domain-containing protein n=1 Tax=Pannonibacter tanglangensis TaxID=2750084 RepID=A0A7X5F0D1_9HYPH|nr:ATP-binding cassette domain-containing protein [Pannonibacter sp. XCT-53]NBN77463.1 ATP-binding cassette domain-containing protein [Pannonibacter sp. XCT-53]
MSAHSILSVERLEKRYGDVHVLKDINVAMQPGDFLVLVGPSGCGKSTLLGCIAGLSDVTSGSIRIAGEDRTHAEPASRDIAMVFQSYALFPNMTVGRNIGFGLEVRKVSDSERDARVREVAEMLKIGHLLDRKPAELSGGQRQRVAMGRALVREPKLFLFDEPLSNLDAKLRVTMRTEIKRMHQATGASIIYVTHDQIEAMTLATRIVVMKDGVVQQIGTPREIYDTPVNTFVADFMGAPAMNLMPAKVSRQDGAIRIEIATAGGQPLVLTDYGNAPTLLPESPADLIVGLRPEAITDNDQADGRLIQRAACLLDVVEPAGADTYAVITLGGTEAIARLSGDATVTAGEIVPLSFNLSKISYFDPHSGKRL